ncbi:hypothetical protein ES705_42808 [subsurface metagenome]
MVVTTGDTLVLSLEATVPIEVIVTVSALETLQVRIELSPWLIVEGEAEKILTIGPQHPVINTETAIIQNKIKILL